MVGGLHHPGWIYTHHYHRSVLRYKMLLCHNEPTYFPGDRQLSVSGQCMSGLILTYMIAGRLAESFARRDCIISWRCVGKKCESKMTSLYAAAHLTLASRHCSHCLSGDAMTLGDIKRLWAERGNPSVVRIYRSFGAVAIT